jgi:hypothetical protein
MGSTAAAATPSTVAALAQIGLRVAALAQISYMASGSVSAPAGDGTPLSPPLSLSHNILAQSTVGSPNHSKIGWEQTRINLDMNHSSPQARKLTSAHTGVSNSKNKARTKVVEEE